MGTDSWDEGQIFSFKKTLHLFLFITLLCFSSVAWSGFHWIRCRIQQLWWYSGKSLWSCEFRTFQGTFYHPHSYLIQNNCSSSSFVLKNCMQVTELLKDRPSWYRDCRNVNVLTVIPTANGGTIELVYMQVYFH